MDDVNEEEEEEGYKIFKTMMTNLRFRSGGKANPVEARGVTVRGAPGHFAQCTNTVDDCDHLICFLWLTPLI